MKKEVWKVMLEQQSFYDSPQKQKKNETMKVCAEINFVNYKFALTISASATGDLF